MENGNHEQMYDLNSELKEIKDKQRDSGKFTKEKKYVKPRASLKMNPSDLNTKDNFNSDATKAISSIWKIITDSTRKKSSK